MASTEFQEGYQAYHDGAWAVTPYQGEQAAEWFAGYHKAGNEAAQRAYEAAVEKAGLAEIQAAIETINSRLDCIEDQLHLND